MRLWSVECKADGAARLLLVGYGEVTKLMTDAVRVAVSAKAEKEARSSDEVMKAAIEGGGEW